MNATNMNALKLIALALPLAAASICRAEGEPETNNINPALLYFQAFEVAPKLTEADSEYFDHPWQLQRLPEKFGDLVARHDNEFKLLRKAARSDAPCDWGVDLSEGPETLLPQLARCKAAAIAARLRVEWDGQHGRSADAREDFLAALALARNISRDGTLISTLVQFASESILCTTLAESFGQFSPQDLQLIGQGFTALPPHTLSECIPAELSMTKNWVLRQLQQLQQNNAGDDAKTLSALYQKLTGLLEADEKQPRTIPLNKDINPSEWWQQLTQAAGGTSDGVVKLILQSADVLAPKLAAVLELPYSQFTDGMAQFKAEVEQSPNPYFSRFLLPAWEKAKRREFRVQVWRAMAQAAIQYKLHGEAGLANVPDPAGSGPFAFRRFVFQGVDRGFELKSAIDTGNGWPDALIFVEKEGPPFYVVGRNAGQPVQR